MRKGRFGLSLVELLVVLLIIAVLMGMLLPAVQRARESTRLITCQNNLRQMGLAVHSYHSSEKLVPPLYNGSFTHEGSKIEFPSNYWREHHFHSWQTAILPQLELNALYSQIDFAKAASDPFHQQVANVEVATYVCPSTNGIEADEVRQYAPNDVIGTAARTDYESIGGIRLSSESVERNGVRLHVRTNVDPGIWGLPLHRKDYDGTQGIDVAAFSGVDKTSFRKVTDGLSKTMMIGETSGRPEFLVRGENHDKVTGNIIRASWPISGSHLALLLKPENGVNKVNYLALYSFHTQGANAAIADGSVRLFSNSTDEKVLEALATRDGKENTVIAL